MFQIKINMVDRCRIKRNTHHNQTIQHHHHLICIRHINQVRFNYIQHFVCENFQLLLMICFDVSSVNGPAPPNPGSGSPRLATHLKHHLLQKGYGNQSPTSPQSFVNGPGMHQPMGPPQMQHVRMQVCVIKNLIGRE